ncbi:serine/threonine-protein kinase [Sphingomonas sp. HF-S4]|uniref:Serine/threonine-protein kinase n=1 Tax=Sphingomonas agrestis TaxID=3080540 RepID=A0ABU3YCB3_9SPHN|nr:serine/threonine-protein kinase [Sphingomonas sp. HF-S4]MDV3459035.1 serine/threonine-protein kinase [Sphingomonas sp. HF-S4]
MAGFISKLTIGAKLGEGHFGEVFKGTDPTHGDVAVKIIRFDPAEYTAASWAQFKQDLSEAKNLAKAAHRNVVQVYHVVEAPDGLSVNICMAYCPGGALQKPFEIGPMTLVDVRKVGTEVSIGLAAMHTRGMIHRDIKPANILRDRIGVAQLSDFGLVTDNIVLGYASDQGYSDHIAYEVWHGKGTSVKSDIWALGMTLYRLLHGKTWYDASPSPRYVTKQGGFAKSLKWLPHIPKPWRRVIRKMLNDDSSARYQSVAAVLRGLANLPTTPVWTPSVMAKLVRWVQLKGTRKIVVEWKRHSPRNHEWRAWSEPLGAGQSKTLGGSTAALSASQAARELEEFFNI